MSYTPNQWKSGDKVTSNKLNHIEQGIADASSSGALIVTVDAEGQLDKTYKDIWDALEVGTPVYLLFVYGNYTTSYESTCWNCPITVAYKYNNSYTVIASRPSMYNGVHLPAILFFITDNISGYPVFFNKRYVTSSSTSTNQDYVY